jgi:two-component system chemotaxis response regulator CheY
MKQCLVVDDSSVIRKVARRILEDMNFEIVEAEDGQKALEECRKTMPDAILLDWNMPVMDGLEFLTSLRARGRRREPDRRVLHDGKRRRPHRARHPCQGRTNTS